MLWLIEFLFQRGISMRKRTILTLVVALTAAACQKKATGQTIAVVNGEEITASELNDALTSDNVLAGASTKEARAAELQKLVDRKLVVQQAKSDGVDKSPEFLNQQRRLTEDLLMNMLISKRLNASQVPSANEIATFEAAHPQMFANREMWTLDQIIYPLPKDAAVMAKLNASKTIDEVAQILTAGGIQFTRGSRQIDTALFPDQIYQKILHVAPGEPFLASGPDKGVANVIKAREPAPLSADQARAVALNAMRKGQVDQIVQDRVKELRAKAKIEYQPGFEPPAKK
jgi:EpsD family peptidyl-prolyl cis-trans isomerase